MKRYFYKLNFDENNYIVGFYTVLETGEYDYICNENEYLPEDVTEGWYKFVSNGSGRGNFVVDETKKAEIIAKREEEAKKPTDMDKLQAQSFYTAMVTDTLLEEE